MSKEHFIVTINEKELRYIACCDCGLVHEVSYDIFENKVDMHFVRDEARTIRARIERKKDKGKKLGELLDEALGKEPARPLISYKQNFEEEKCPKKKSQQPF